MALETTIEINGLRLFARHGVAAQERVVGNEFEITLHVTAPVEGALLNDNLAATLNYAEITDLIKNCMAVPAALLEHVAYDIRRAVLDRYPEITAGMVRVAKLTPPIPADMDSVAVVIRW